MISRIKSEFWGCWIELGTNSSEEDCCRRKRVALEPRGRVALRRDATGSWTRRDLGCSPVFGVFCDFSSIRMSIIIMVGSNMVYLS